MAFEILKESLLNFASFTYGECISNVRFQTSRVNTSHIVSPFFKELSARTDMPASTLFDAFIKSESYKKNAGVDVCVDDAGLLHCSIVNTNAWLDSLPKLNVENSSFEASTLNTSREYLWKSVLGKIASSVNLKIDTLPKNFQPLDVNNSYTENVPNKVLQAVFALESVVCKVGVKAVVKGGQFISLDESLFKIIYAEHLIGNFVQGALGYSEKPSENIEKPYVSWAEIQNICALISLWNVVKQDSVQENTPRIAILHAINLCENVIKCYTLLQINKGCLSAKDVKQLKEILTRALGVIKEVRLFLNCPQVAL